MDFARLRRAVRREPMGARAVLADDRHDQLASVRADAATVRRRGGAVGALRVQRDALLPGAAGRVHHARYAAAVVPRRRRLGDRRNPVRSARREAERGRPLVDRRSRAGLRRARQIFGDFRTRRPARIFPRLAAPSSLALGFQALARRRPRAPRLRAGARLEHAEPLGFFRLPVEPRGPRPRLRRQGDGPRSRRASAPRSR